MTDLSNTTSRNVLIEQHTYIQNFIAESKAKIQEFVNSYDLSSLDYDGLCSFNLKLKLMLDLHTMELDWLKAVEYRIQNLSE